VPPVGEADIMGGHRPPDFVGVAHDSQGKTAPQAGIVEAGVVVGHGQQGNALGSLGNQFD